VRADQQVAVGHKGHQPRGIESGAEQFELQAGGQAQGPGAAGIGQGLLVVLQRFGQAGAGQANHQQGGERIAHAFQHSRSARSGTVSAKDPGAMNDSRDTSQ